MILKTKICVSIIALFIFLNCSSTYIKISKDYTGKKLEPGEFALYLPTNAYTNIKMDEIFGQGKSDSLYLEFFKDVFPDVLIQHSCITKLSVIKTSLETELSQTLLDLKDTTKMKINIPKQGTTIKLKNRVPKYILFLSNLRCMGDLSETSFINLNTNQLTTMNLSTITTEANFVIWDNNLGKIISYGFCSVPIKKNYSFSKYLLKDSLLHFAGKMLEGTSFYNYVKKVGL